MHGIGDVRSAVAGHAARRRELPEEKPHTILIRRDLRMDFGVSTFQIGARIERGAAVPGTSDIDDIRIMLFDQAIEMDIDEVLPRRSPPVPEQSWFDLLLSLIHI